MIPRMNGRAEKTLPSLRRRRDNHERELIESALSLVAYNRPDIIDTLNARERRALLRRFYRQGDLTANRAVYRAIRFAIRSEVE